MEILDSAQDLDFLSLVVLLAANPMTYSKGSYIPQAGAFKMDHISYIHYASWLKDHFWGILHLGLGLSICQTLKTS